MGEGILHEVTCRILHLNENRVFPKINWSADETDMDPLNFTALDFSSSHDLEFK